MKPRPTTKKINERLILEQIHGDSKAKKLVLDKVRKLNKNKGS